GCEVGGDDLHAVGNKVEICSRSRSVDEHTLPRNQPQEVDGPAPRPLEPDDTIIDWCVQSVAQPVPAVGVDSHIQNSYRTPALNTRPSSGAHASVVHRPSGERAGRISGSCEV